MSNNPRSLLDLRAWRRREDRRLALVIMLFLVVVGGIVIGLVYDWDVALTGAVCLMAGAAIFGLLWLILLLVERWVGRDS